jgi:hypothetical protein
VNPAGTVAAVASGAVVVNTTRSRRDKNILSDLIRRPPTGQCPLSEVYSFIGAFQFTGELIAAEVAINVSQKFFS